MRNLFAKLSLLALLLAAPSALLSQDNSAMTGVVTDASGAVLPNTVVTLTNPSRGTKITQTTNSEGLYRFANVPPAPGYKATFTHAGFSDVSYTDLSLLVGITRTQNAALAVGAAQEVEVSAGSNTVTLNTTDASIGNNFDLKQVVDLPIQNRSSVNALFSIQPGVANSSFTGARTDQSSVTLDGMDANDIAAGAVYGGVGGSGAIVGGAPVDSIQEFRGLVGGLPPVNGTGSGGQFQLVTKSGTNRFHGNLNEYHRDTSTSANSWFNNNAGIGRPALIRNQFGGAIGGPIKRDKLFFFFDFNNSRIIQSANVERVVPLDSYRNGTISYIRNVSSTSGNTCTAASRQNTTPDCIGQLTPAQVAALDPQKLGESAALFSFINANYPHANDLAYSSADGINTGGYRFNFAQPDFLYNYVGRVDYNFTPKQRIFARFSIAREDAVQSANAFPSGSVNGQGTGTTNPFQDRSYSFVVSHIWQVGANKVNQFYYGDTVQKYNFPSLNYPLGTTTLGLGGSTASGVNLFGPFNSPSSQKRRVPIPEIRDDFNWQLGAHNLGFGGTFKFIKTNSQLVNDFNGVTLGIGGNNLSLDSSVRPTVANGYGTAAIRTAGTTSSAVYDEAFALALGRIASIGSSYNYDANGKQTPQGQGTIRAYRFFQTELYVGDTWKVTRGLTLTYGLRYQLYSVPYETHGEQSVQNVTFDQYFAAREKQSAAGVSGANAVPFITYTTGGKANNGAPLYQPSYKDFAPRFAFAYNPAYSPKTVINGSVGLVYDRTVINAVNFIQDQSSYLFQNSANTQYGGSGAVAGLGPTNPRLGTGLTFTNPNVAPTITKPYTPWVTASGVPYGLTNNEFNTIVDPTLKDPYSIVFNAGVQQELPGNFLLKLNYAGRLGRRLLAQTDASQLVDFRDPASGQTMAQAFATLTQQGRSGAPYTAQPFFESQGGAGTTANFVSGQDSLIKQGDFADAIQAAAVNGYIKPNVGMASQFAENTFLTNKGFSSYNGMLVTLAKNFSQGVQFDLNYTWSHSIDNTSPNANYIAFSGNTGSGSTGFICDATQPRECRANSDFDTTNVINGDFTYLLPVGRGRTFGSHMNTFLNEIIGGWQVSGLPTYRSGYALSTQANAYVAGYASNAPAIFVGNRSDVAAHPHKDAASNTVLLFGKTAADAVNIAQTEFVGPIGLQLGQRNNLRGPSAFYLDSGLLKVFALLPNERLNLKFRADFFNVLNHPVFALPNTDITSGSFGQITSTASTARVGQFALRLEF